MIQLLGASSRFSADHYTLHYPQFRLGPLQLDETVLSIGLGDLSVLHARLRVRGGSQNSNGMSFSYPNSFSNLLKL